MVVLSVRRAQVTGHGVFVGQASFATLNAKFVGVLFSKKRLLVVTVY